LFPEGIKETIGGPGYLGPTSFTGPGTINFDIRTFTVPLNATPGTYTYDALIRPILFIPGDPGNPRDTVTPTFPGGGWGEPFEGEFTLTVPAPEPSSLSLLFGGIAALIFVPLMPLRRCKP
jgi:hypothetical protein